MVQNTFVLFPGQGAQRLGMQGPRSEFLERIFDIAKSVLGYDLLDLVENGPLEVLSQTKYSQLATLVCSWIEFCQIKSERPELFSPDRIIHFAGLSMGEYTALAASGVISFEDCLRLVNARADAMQQASELEAGAMMTVIGLPENKVKDVCHVWRNMNQSDFEIPTRAILDVSNYLFPKGVVVSGNAKGIEWASSSLKAAGASICKPLPVSGAFHTSMMESAIPFIGEAMEKVQLHQLDEHKLVYSNVSGGTYREMSRTSITQALSDQLVQAVQWKTILKTVVTEYHTGDFIIDCGPGRQAQSMLRMMPNSKLLMPFIVRAGDKKTTENNPASKQRHGSPEVVRRSIMFSNAGPKTHRFDAINPAEHRLPKFSSNKFSNLVNMKDGYYEENRCISFVYSNESKMDNRQKGRRLFHIS